MHLRLRAETEEIAARDEARRVGHLTPKEAHND